MSTRSLINVKCSDEKIRSSYIHFDGMDHLETLQKHYNLPAQAESLVMMGDMSSLGERLLPSEDSNHSFETPEEGVCVFYGRDRGEDLVGPIEFNSFDIARKQDRGQEYIYEFDNEWTQHKVRI